MIRRLRVLVGIVLVLWLALFVQLNLVQLGRGEELRAHPLNSRDVERDFTRARGPIVTVDGEIIARTVEVEGDLERLRVYPDGPLYAHVTGYLSFAYGATGLERAFNDELAGATAAQRLGSLQAVLSTEARLGTVISTVDSRLQRAARDALGDRRGSVVAIDPTDGAIRALWSTPTFDPNELSSHDLAAVDAARRRLLDDPANPLRSRAYAETFFPGSTFKIVTTAAALASGDVTPTTPRFAPTDAYVPPLTDRPIRNFGGSVCGGDLTEALRVSCNTTFAELGVTLGAEALGDAASAFGFGADPPLGFAEVEASTFPAPEVFDQATPLLAQAAIGQFDVRATPLQMALVAAAVANDGVIAEPRLVADVTTVDGSLDAGGPAVWRQATGTVISANLREMMRVVATEGTARGLLPEGVTGGGKTGTAQLGDGTEDTHAWIVGFAPFEAPRLAVAVLVEAVPGSGQQTGGETAAPIARQVLTVARDLGYLDPG